MQIRGKFGCEELLELAKAFGVAIILGLAAWFFLWLCSKISWIVPWALISFIFTPIIFWILRYENGEIEIEDITEDDNKINRIF